MKIITGFGSLFILLTALFSFVGSNQSFKAGNNDISGAWQMNLPEGMLLMVVEDDYCSITLYNAKDKKFFYSRGGVVSAKNGNYQLKVEFNSLHSEEVGKTLEGKYKLAGNSLQLEVNGKKEAWTRVDETPTGLAGCWRINGRLNDGKMTELKLSPRKTLKILSGSRFQWMAINTETKAFFGTGGGTYTFENGKYTEHIEFFSRDSTRVGASLTFDGKVENGIWHHSGMSSKGEPVQETWIRIK